MITPFIFLMIVIARAEDNTTTEACCTSTNSTVSVELKPTIKLFSGASVKSSIGIGSLLLINSILSYSYRPGI